MANVIFRRDPERVGNLNVYINGEFSYTTPERLLDAEIEICVEHGDTYEIPPSDSIEEVSAYMKRRAAQKGGLR